MACKDGNLIFIRK